MGLWVEEGLCLPLLSRVMKDWRRERMSESVGLVSFPSDNETFLKPYSDETAQMIDKEARELIETCYNRTLEMVTTKKDLVTELADSPLL